MADFRNSLRAGCLLLAVLALAGCRSYGPSRREKLRQLFLDIIPGRAAMRDAKGLLHEDPAVRRESLLRIARRGDIQTVNAVRLMVSERTESSPLVRATAATTLRELGDRRVTPELLAALSDPNPIVRRDVVISLGHLGSKADIPALARMLKSDFDGEVRSAAVDAIGRIGGDDAVEALIPFVEDRDEFLSYNVNRTLAKLTGHEFGMNKRRWEEWWRANKDRPPKPSSSSEPAKSDEGSPRGSEPR